MHELTQKDTALVNEWEGYFSFKMTWLFSQFINCRSRVRCLFTANQYGKTNMVIYEYVMRILGLHPIDERNFYHLPAHLRTIRFASENLPNDAEGEKKNTQYPALRRWLPTSLIKKDITIRKPVMTIKDPMGGPDYFIEFVGYNQTTQSQAGVQRCSVFMDEEAPYAFYEEQIPRLLAANGDIVYSLTPVESMTYTFDELYEKASLFYRTKKVCARMKLRLNEDATPIMRTDSTSDIAVFQAATDDNPIYTQKQVDDIFGLVTDDEALDVRRYGIFRQISGRIFKEMDKRVHVIDIDKYFPVNIPHEWLHARMIDYHEQNPWACVWAVISPFDEVFVYDELMPSPDRFVTHEIAQQMAAKSKDYRYPINLIDPNSAKTQPNTGMSVLDDLNRLFYQFRRDNYGTGGYWQSWDTKSTKGRDEIRKRLKGSKLVGRPFNNLIEHNGKKERIPTIWFSSRCTNTITSMASWKMEEWLGTTAMTKDDKEKPEQRHSHFPMCLEAVFKFPGFRAPKLSSALPATYKQPAEQLYFSGRL